MDITNLYHFLIIFIICSSPIIFTCFNIYNLLCKNKKAESLFHVLTIIIGVILSGLLIVCLFMNGEYDHVIYGEGYHSFISGKYGLSFWLPLITGFISIIIISLWNKYKPPLISFLLMGSIYISDIFMIFGIIQLIKNLNFFVFCLILFCFNCLIITISVGKREIQMFLKIYKDNEVIPIRKWTLKIYRLLLKTSSGKFFSILGMIPISIILYLILLLMGQGPSGFIKAFTETADWTFSQHIPPPNEDGHYLCTVAAKGHEKLVKPLRTGIRHGIVIKVNRQLCVANAFEEIIAEKTPKIHRVVRTFYDKHGYPLSRKITSVFRADVVYVVMKPLEYLFAAVIYLSDKNPENRIAVQYMGNKKIKKESEK